MGKCLTIYMNEEAKEVWAGNLSDGSYAVLLLNKGSLTNKLKINWNEIGFNNTKAKIRDLWKRKNLGIFKNQYKTILKSHTSQLLKITPIKPINELKNIKPINELKNKIYILFFTYIKFVIIIIFVIIIGFLIFKNKRKKFELIMDSEINKINKKDLEDS